MAILCVCVYVSAKWQLMTIVRMIHEVKILQLYTTLAHIIVVAADWTATALSTFVRITRLSA